MTVLRGRATEYERQVPFQVFTDALAHLDPHALDGFQETDAVAPLLQRSGAVDRFGLHRSAAVLLARLATPSGLLLALDDLHWADPASLELLDHLVRHPLHAPVVLAVTRRDRQSPESLAARLTRELDTGTVIRLGLRPLSARDCAELAGPGLPPAETAALYAASEGNPFYFLTLLQAHRGRTAPEPSAPPGLGSLLLDELTVLAPSRRGIVDAVAVLGEHATPAMVSRVTGRSGTAFTADVHALTRRDLLRSAPQGLLTLRHPVVRTLVHESTPFLRRVEIHRLAAQELARAGASAAERAHHVEQSLTAWDPAAVAVLDEAAARTARTAPASCAHWLDVALRHLPHTPEHASRRRELVLRRARALAACGGLRESRDLLQELIATPRRSSGGPATGENQGLRVRAVVLCALVERHLGRCTEAVALLRRELARDPAPADVVRLGLELGSAAPQDSDTSYTQVRTEVEGALAAARSMGDEVGEAGVLAVAALGEAYEGNMTAAHELARQAAALVDSLPDNDLTALCEPLARLGWAEAFLEHYPDAERHAERGLDIARRSGQLYVRAPSAAVPVPCPGPDLPDLLGAGTRRPGRGHRPRDRQRPVARVRTGEQGRGTRRRLPAGRSASSRRRRGGGGRGRYRGRLVGIHGLVHLRLGRAHGRRPGPRPGRDAPGGRPRTAADPALDAAALPGDPGHGRTGDGQVRGGPRLGRASVQGGGTTGAADAAGVRAAQHRPSAAGAGGHGSGGGSVRGGRGGERPLRRGLLGGPLRCCSAPRWKRRRAMAGTARTPGSGVAGSPRRAAAESWSASPTPPVRPAAAPRLRTVPRTAPNSSSGWPP